MKKPFLNISFLSLMRVTSLARGAESSSSSALTPAQLELATISTAIVPLIQEIRNYVSKAYDLDPVKFKNGDYFYDPITKKKLNTFMRISLGNLL